MTMTFKVRNHVHSANALKSQYLTNCWSHIQPHRRNCHHEISVSEVKAKIITNALNHCISQIVAVECHSLDFNMCSNIITTKGRKSGHDLQGQRLLLSTNWILELKLCMVIIETMSRT